MMGDIQKYNIAFFETLPMPIANIIRNVRRANPNAQDENGNTLLHGFVLNHRFKPALLQALINRADLEIRNATGKTVFLLAVVHRQRKMIEVFIEHGANVDVRDNMGNNGIHYMVLPELNFYFDNIDELSMFPVEDEDRLNFKDRISILEELLNKEVDVNVRNRRGDTPLMWAARGYHVDIVKMLLASDAKLDIQNENSESCLHFASTCTSLNSVLWDKKEFAILYELLRHGAPVNCFDKYGNTALGYILHSGHANHAFFACEYIKTATLVHWRTNIQFFVSEGRIIGGLPSHEDMVNHAEACHDEVDRMVSFQLTERHNLCQFALGEASNADRSIDYQISDKVLAILSRETFEEYHDFIKSSFQRSYLRKKILELVFHTRLEERNILLMGDILYIISDFLGDNDLFNVIFTSL